MNRHEVLFWVCVGLCLLDVMLAYIAHAVPTLNQYTNLYLLCAFFSAVGVIANYINCKQAEKTSKGK